LRCKRCKCKIKNSWYCKDCAWILHHINSHNPEIELGTTDFKEYANRNKKGDIDFNKEQYDILLEKQRLRLKKQ